MTRPDLILTSRGEAILVVEAKSTPASAKYETGRERANAGVHVRVRGTLSGQRSAARLIRMLIPVLYAPCGKSPHAADARRTPCDGSSPTNHPGNEERRG